MTTTATKPATAEELYAEGMSLLEVGDTLGASETLWAAAATAMEAYAKERGWELDKYRTYFGVFKSRLEELGLHFGPDTPNPVSSSYGAARTLEANAWEHGELLDENDVRKYGHEMRYLLDVFQVDR